MAGVAGAPVAPTFDNVRLGGPNGLRYPLEVQSATFVVGKELDLNLAGVTSPLVLTPSQAGANYITLTGATGAISIQLPFGNASKQFIVANHSGQTITFQIAPGPGGTASTGVAVSNNFRQILCVDRQVADVRPAAAAIAY